MKSVQYLAVLGLALAAGTAMGQGTSFGTATGLSPAAFPVTVSGGLDSTNNHAAVLGPETLLQTFAAQFNAANTVNSYSITGLAAGSNFRVETALAAGQSPYDTRMRVRNSSLAVLGNDDDGAGGGFSRVTGTVPGDGQLSADVTWWQDSTYVGSHSQSGWFDLNVYGASVISPRTYGTNTQWWAFTGLTPGAAFSAEVIAATLTAGTGVGADDTILGAFDSAHNMLGFDDDSGAGAYSLLNGTIPADGIVYIAVSAYQGSSFGPSNAASYNNENNNGSTGSFTLAFVPTPGAAGLLALGGLVGMRRRRA